MILYTYYATEINLSFSFKYNDLAELANTFNIKIDSKQQQPIKIPPNI